MNMFNLYASNGKTYYLHTMHFSFSKIQQEIASLNRRKIPWLIK